MISSSFGGDGLLDSFFESRNLSSGTCNGYRMAINNFEIFKGDGISNILEDYINDGSVVRDDLIQFRLFLFDKYSSSNTLSTYFTRVKTFLKHFGVSIPELPLFNGGDDYVSCYDDLPTHDMIRIACDNSSLQFKCVLLFMSSSGTAKAETVALTVDDFVSACGDYIDFDYDSYKVLFERLLSVPDLVPCFYIKRLKTGRFYYTFCSGEAAYSILEFLLTRGDVSGGDSLFGVSDHALLNFFQRVNDDFGWGRVGVYRRFRSHSIRKFHASNFGASREVIDSLQGRGDDGTHEAYFKSNPVLLREVYCRYVCNVLIYNRDSNIVDDSKGDGAGLVLGVAEELLKYRELLELGCISLGEFELIKLSLLGDVL